ncbi:MAG: hypothetical protein AB4040_14950, partial [Synechococcus sp.]
MANLDIGFEVLADIIDEQGIDNRIKGSAKATDPSRAQAIGVENAELGDAPNAFSLDLDGGRDTIKGDATARAGEEAFADGIRNTGRIELGSKTDRILGTGRATSTGDGRVTFATGINSTSGGVIRGGAGNDILKGKATSIDEEDVGAFGILTSDTNTDQGNDWVKGTAIASGIASTEARGVSVGLSDIDDDTIAGNNGGFAPTASGAAEVGQLLTGDGHDTLQGSANVILDAQEGDEVFFASANGIVNDGGTIAQLEQLLASIGKTLDNFTAEDVKQIIDQLDTSTLDTGAGNDTMEVTAEIDVTGGVQGVEGGDEDLEVFAEGVENSGLMTFGDGNDSIV